MAKRFQKFFTGLGVAGPNKRQIAAHGRPCNSAGRVGEAGALRINSQTQTSSGALALNSRTYAATPREVFERMKNQPGENVFDWSKPEFEARDNSEIAAAASDRPK